MSKQVATLLVGLLAMAEGRTNDRTMLNEANREDVLSEIDHEMLDKIAHRLYAEDSEHLSAYERLVKDDKRKKMEYLNNIRPDLGESEPHHTEEVAPVREHHSEDHHYTVDDIPKPDPTKESIRDKVLQESKRRQNDLMEAKRQAEELAKEDEERQAREAEASKLTPEERETKRK